MYTRIYDAENALNRIVKLAKYRLRKRRKIRLNRFKRITAIVLIMILMCSNFVFAGAAAIVSPTANTIVYSDSFLVSVKIAEPKTIRVTVYEQKELNNEQLISVNVVNINAEDLVLIAEGPIPLITGETVVTEVEVSAVATLSDGSAVKSYTPVALSEAATYTCIGQLGFYTKQIDNVKPGLYKIEVETLNAAAEVTETINNFVAVKVKPVAEKVNIFETPQTGALQFLQNLLKNIFR
jgi:hypothetical protein